MKGWNRGCVAALMFCLAFWVLVGMLVWATVAQADDGWELYRPAKTYTVAGAIQHVFGARSRQALCVARHESSLNPKAVNRNRDGSVDRGLFQINSVHRAWANLRRLFEPLYNARCAFRAAR